MPTPDRPRYSGFSRIEELVIRLFFNAIHTLLSALLARHLWDLSHLQLAVFYLCGAIASVRIAHHLFYQFELSRAVQRSYRAFEQVIDLRVKPLSLLANTLVLSASTYFSLFPATNWCVESFEAWYGSLDGATVASVTPYRFWLVVGVFLLLFLVAHPLLVRVGTSILANDLYLRMLETPEEFMTVLQHKKMEMEREVERQVNEARLFPLEVVKAPIPKNLSFLKKKK